MVRLRKVSCSDRTADKKLFFAHHGPERVSEANESKDRNMEKWFVYILKCKNESLYTGITKDVEKRLEKHARGKGGSYTKAFGADKIVYREKYLTKNEALKREVQIKRWPRKKKLVLISGDMQLLKKS